ncbi:MAG: aldo/keto reductase [Acholeplasmataceae bacterium]|nr:aldo/keto reductase [Acholeplasmataceae bacterium]
MRTLQQTYELSNGVKNPKIGFGTWQVPDGDVAHMSVTLALKNGYRHIDTAYVYENEKSVGEAILHSGIPREEIFVTSKLPSHIKTYDGAIDYFQRTLDNLGFNYLDLFLIHAPWPWSEIGKDCREGNVEAFKAMIKLYKEKKIRSIGVSNFSPADIDNIIEHTGFVPHVNQIAFFIGHKQAETHAYCTAKKILVEAYSPLALGKALMNNEIKKMAEKYNVSAAQICVRYCVQKGTVPLPKSTHETRMIENSSVDFEISNEDMTFLDQINEDPRRF